MNPAVLKDMTGARCHRLTVIEQGANQNRHARWVCVCDCGKKVLALGIHLRSGHTKSCGCLSADMTSRRSLVHGERRKGQCATSEYRTWVAMNGRCDDSSPDYRLYGARGIKVCARWRNSFAAFLSDMGRKPSPTHSIDRINNDGDYEPSNCQWATSSQQARNTRRNRFVTFNGQTLTIGDWANGLGMNRLTLFSRIVRRKWPIERALSTPTRKFTRVARNS